MRSIALVLIGVVAGIAATFLGFQHFGSNTKKQPAPTTDTEIGSISSTATDRAPVSPFAPVTDVSNNHASNSDTSGSYTSSSDNIGSDTSGNHTSANNTHQTTNNPGTVKTYSLPNTPASDINHYRELTAYLQHIDTVDEQQLENLLNQLKPTPHDSSFTNTLSTAIYQRWGEVDIDSALEYAIAKMESSRNSRSGYQSHLASQAITHLAQQYPDIVSRKVEEISGNNSESHLKHLVYQGISANDPEQFMKTLLESENNRERDEMTMMALMNWAQKDPAAAFNFLENDSSGAFESYHRENVLLTWFEQDPNAALPEIEAAINASSTSHPGEQMMLIDMYSRHLAQDDPDAALQWALSLDQVMHRENALMNILHNIENADPDSMMSFIDQLDDENKARLLPMAVPAIASSMGRSDPFGALEWADQLPQQQGYNAKEIVISEWAQSDPDAATQWLLSQPDSPANHNLMRSAAYSTIYSDPDRGMDLYQRLPADMQVELIEPILSSLAQQDPDNARQWLSEQNNPQLQQRGLLLLEMRNPDADTYTLLDQLAALPQQEREGMMFSIAIERSYQDPDTVAQWLTETTAITSEERDMLQQIIRDQSRYGRPPMPFGGSSEFYLRNMENPIEK